MIPEMFHCNWIVRLGRVDDRGFVSDFTDWNVRPHGFAFDD